MDETLAALLMRLAARRDVADPEAPVAKAEPTKFQRKAALKANDIASRMDIPRNRRYKQQMMEVPGEVMGGRVTGGNAVAGHLPGMERLIDALQLAESTMQRNRGEQEHPTILPALTYGMTQRR